MWDGTYLPMKICEEDLFGAIVPDNIMVRPYEANWIDFDNILRKYRLSEANPLIEWKLNGIKIQIVVNHILWRKSLIGIFSPFCRKLLRVNRFSQETEERWST